MNLPSPAQNRRALADAWGRAGLGFARGLRMGHAGLMSQRPTAATAVCQDCTPSLPPWPARVSGGPFSSRQARGAGFRPRVNLPFPPKTDGLIMAAGRWRRASVPNLPLTTKRGSLSCSNPSLLWAWSWRLPPATALSIPIAPAWAPWPVAFWVRLPKTTWPPARWPAVLPALSPLIRAIAAKTLRSGKGPAPIHGAIRSARAFRMAFFLGTPRQRAANQDPRGGSACSRRS